MSYLLSLAFRNALRNRRRSLFTLVSIFMGVALYIISQSFIDGIEKTLVATEIDHEHSHLRVMPKDWLQDEDFRPLDVAFSEQPQVESLLRSAHPDATVSGRLTFAAEIGDGTRALTSRGVVIDVASYQKLVKLGDLPVPEGPEPYVWVGADLAKAFDWKAGDRFFLKAKTRKGAMNALDGVVIAGLVASGHPIVDNYSVFLPEAFGRDFLGAEPGYWTEVMARFKDPAQAVAAGEAIEAAHPRIAAETWREKTDYLIELNDIRRQHFGILVFIILLIAASSVANTCLMSGFERRHEIGTLLALGYPQRRVVVLFITEAVIIGVLGAVIGVALGTALSGYYTSHGLPLPEFNAQEAVMPMPPVLFFEWTPVVALKGLIIGFFVTVLASLYPAWRSSRLDPISALRTEG